MLETMVMFLVTYEYSWNEVKIYRPFADHHPLPPLISLYQRAVIHCPVYPHRVSVI